MCCHFQGTYLLRQNVDCKSSLGQSFHFTHLTAYVLPHVPLDPVQLCSLHWVEKMAKMRIVTIDNQSSLSSRSKWWQPQLDSIKLGYVIVVSYIKLLVVWVGGISYIGACAPQFDLSTQ